MYFALRDTSNTKLTYTMKKLHYHILLFALICISANAQQKYTQKADKLFNNLAYTDAIEEYTKLIENGKAGPYIYAQLAKGYTILNDTKQAESFYKKAAKVKNADPEVIYGYAQSLKANGKSSEYAIWMGKFAQSKPNDPRANAFTSDPNYLSKLLAMEPAFTIKNAEKLNSKHSDFGSFVQNNTIYFTSARNTKRKNHNLNGEPFLDIYAASLDGSSIGSPELLSGDVNTKYHEGTIAISPDGKHMYFDRNDYFEGDFDKSTEGVNQINMYRAEKISGKWENIQSVSFNDDNYSTGHPALSPDGKTLYFSSDKPGGVGNSDIYMVSVKANGTFGPVQTVADINTAGTEVFPFVDSNGTLYFSSDGHLGMGGLDAFAASKSKEAFSTPKNLGPGVNSGSDDFAIHVNPENMTGFISSNRQGGIGGDDIYILGQIPPCDVDAALTVKDESGNGIPKALIQLVNKTEGVTNSDTATTTGNYLFSSKCNREYTVTASANGYKSKTDIFTIGKDNSSNTIILEAIPVPEPINTKTEIVLNRIITETEVILNPIYFDFDKSNIRPDAATELDRLITVMNNYQTMVISAESHTDSRGPNTYNQALSQRRAESIRDYVISKGINSSRISGVGRGESDPAVNCSINCTVDEHQLNRRCTFKIISR